MLSVSLSIIIKVNRNIDLIWNQAVPIYSKAELRNWSRSFRLASLSWSPLSFLTLSLIYNTHNIRTERKKNLRTNLFTSQNTPSFFILFPLPASFLVFLPLPFFAFSSFTIIRWSRPISMLPFSAMLMAAAGPAVFFYTSMTAFGPRGWPGRRTAPIAEGQMSP